MAEMISGKTRRWFENELTALYTERSRCRECGDAIGAERADAKICALSVCLVNTTHYVVGFSSFGKTDEYGNKRVVLAHI